jgi:hypothetical protein
LTSAQPLVAQELRFDFSQSRETYSWADSLVWRTEGFGDLPVLLTNRSTATLFKESILLNRKDRWQEGYRTNLTVGWISRSQFSLSTVFRNEYNSFDERLVSENSAGILAVMRLSPNLSIRNTGSIVTAARNNFGLRNRVTGYRNELSAEFSRRFSRSSHLSISVGQDSRIVPEIPVHGLDADLSYSLSGADDSLDMAALGEYQSNKYFTSATSFESVSKQIKSTGGARVVASFRPLLGIRTRVTSHIDYRAFRYRHDQESSASSLLGSDNDSRVYEYKILGERQIADLVILESHYRYRQTDEDFGKLAGSQTVKDGELRTQIRVMPRKGDSVWAEAVFSVTGYFKDQSSSVFSDRDRLMQLFGGGFSHKLNAITSLRVEGSYRDFHQTFVSGELSANNNHNRVYVLEPSVSWVPHPRVDILNSFLLHANYIWYDHEKLLDIDRNTIFRRAEWFSRPSIKLSRRLLLEPSYTYKYEDFGQLLWRDQWVQKKSWDRRTHLPSIELVYTPLSGTRIAPSISYENRKSWEFIIDDDGVVSRVEKEKFERTTMQLQVEFAPSPKTGISASVQRRTQKSSIFADDKTSQFVISIHRVF